MWDVSALPWGNVGFSAKADLQLKAIPEASLKSIEAWASEAHSTAAAADAEPRATHSPTFLRKTWRREEITRQLILHNPYMCSGARICGRSDADTEQLAVRWAREGVTTIGDVLEGGKKRLLTQTEFVERWPNLTHDQWAYEEMLASMPAPWTATLLQFEDGDERQRETWWTDQQGSYWRRWTHPCSDDAPSERRLQRYARERGGGRL